MKLINVGAVVLNQIPMAWEHNFTNIVRAIEEARELGVTLLVLPELSLTGYGCEDNFLSPDLHQRVWGLLQKLIPHSEGMIISVGLPITYQNAVFNAAALLVNGSIAGFVAKRHLAGDGIHYEPRWFKAWPEDLRGDLVVDGISYPIGDIAFDCGGVKVGFEICEDAWVANRPGSKQALRGIDIILNPSASHFAFHKIETRRRFVIEGSRAFNVSYIYANLLGNESGRIIYDGGALIASGGRLLAEGERFSFKDREITTATIDVDLTRMVQARTASFRPLIESIRRDLIPVPFDYPEVLYDPERSVTLPDWEQSIYLKEEEFFRAETLALFDYMRKSYSKGFIVSLSGGADSAAVAVLCAMVVHVGVDQLGFDCFLEKLGYWQELQGMCSKSEILTEMLTTAYQGTRNSSETTLNAAKTVAEAMGSTFYKFDVDQMVSGYRSIVEKALGRELTWDQDDLALQNIQARTRSPGIWMVTNIKGGLLLATSNRSEAAVGYATMDGDTSGGLSPIAGIDKQFLRGWLRWMEQRGPVGYFPVRELEVINVQAPTAELKPQDANQTDETDLMPYDFLDAVERAAIRDKKMPLSVFLTMEQQFPNYSADQSYIWIERFFKLWARNQWKRERYAPSFHLDDENLDPKTWCRFPILSGGFQLELRELRQYLLHNRKKKKK